MIKENIINNINLFSTGSGSEYVPIDSKSSVFHFLLAPNHIDVTAPDSREQGAEDGMTLRGVTRCHHDVTPVMSLTRPPDRGLSFNGGAFLT